MNKTAITWKNERQKLAKLASRRGLAVRSDRGAYTIIGNVEFGPANFNTVRDWLLAQPTTKALAEKHVRDLPGYHQPIYDPENGDDPPPGLVGLRQEVVMLPPGASGDDALRNFWSAEDRVRRRGAPAIVGKLDEARAAIASGDLVPVRVVVSDHDIVSAEATGADLATCLLAAYLTGTRWRRSPRAFGPRSPMAVLASA